MQLEYLQRLERSVASHGDQVVISRHDFEELVDGYCPKTNLIFGRIRDIENRLNRLLKENIQ